MKTVFRYLRDNGIILADLSMMNDFDSQDLEKLILTYSNLVIDEYERKLNEYDGSVTYSQISNELKSEL